MLSWPEPVGNGPAVAVRTDAVLQRVRNGLQTTPLVQASPGWTPMPCWLTRGLLPPQPRRRSRNSAAARSGFHVRLRGRYGDSATLTALVEMWGARGVVLSKLDFAWNHPRDGGDRSNERLKGSADWRQPRHNAAKAAP